MAIKKIKFILIISILIISLSVHSTASNNISDHQEIEIDIDPLCDLEVTVTIKEIRAFDKIDLIGNPDFYVKVFINDVEHISPVWKNQKYVKPNWSITQDVPDDIENVFIQIQLWDKNLLKDQLCDISKNHQSPFDEKDIVLFYNLKTAHWHGSDYISPWSFVRDESGYGRANGCDDNSIYENDNDCELWFDITQTDYDNDGIPYYVETEIYGTDPEIDNTGEDFDNDGVPIEWEFKWGISSFYHWYNFLIYSPFEYENHMELDSDNDGLSNYEEYLTSEWDSDPFRKDLFIEYDYMEESPDGIKSDLSEESKYLLKKAYNRQNIVYHLDDGFINDGGEILPFDNKTTWNELIDIYNNHFLHNDENNWKCGVFHYAMIVYNPPIVGCAMSPDEIHINSFVISSKIVENNKLFIKTQKRRDTAFAGIFMHETGHTLGIFPYNTPGCDDQYGKYPWQRNYWKWMPYRSCMNYRYGFFLVDYSDGSRGKNDFDDWNNIDLTFFQQNLDI